MSTIRGAIIHRSRDEYGEIIVAEDGCVRSLYFGEGVEQSRIRTDLPSLLQEEYNEAMMAALIFNSNPSSVLVIGLGGCSLVHFLLKAVPGCVVDIVEIRREVIDLSGEFFLLPEKKNVKIFHADGAEFLAVQGTDSRMYDFIIMDAFDEAGPAAALTRKEFLAACRSKLNSNGIFVMNAWHSPNHDFPGLYNSVQDVFNNSTLKLLLSESFRNAVVFGFEDAEARRSLPEYRPTAAKLQARHGINFPRYLRRLYWQNFKEQDQ